MLKSESTNGTLPSAGDIYTFSPSPASEFALPHTGRYAAFKVLGSNGKLVAIAVLDGIWGEPPSLKQVAGKPILRERRFSHTGCAVFGVNAEWWSPTALNGLFLLGAVRVSTEEANLAAGIFNFAPGSSYAPLRAANASAEGEWRWTHDRDTYEREVEQKEAQDAAARAAREERYRVRLSKLTWKQLLAETPFERWSPSPPFPPEEFAREARNAIHRACRALSALGPKPRRGAVREVLRECVEWFNEADVRAGRVIETEEREDICSALEEIAYVARQQTLLAEIDRWRDW